MDFWTQVGPSCPVFIFSLTKLIIILGVTLVVGLGFGFLIRHLIR
jgi:hypothetical protein